MARFGSRDLAQPLEAAKTWINKCLIQDQSLFTGERLWTPALIDEVKRAFVDHPDHSKRDFITSALMAFQNRTYSSYTTYKTDVVFTNKCILNKPLLLLF